MSTALRGRSGAACLLLAALAACSEDGPTGGPGTRPPPEPLAAITCRGNTATATLRCDGGGIGANPFIIVGGQGSYVQVTSGAPSLAADSFMVDVNVQNLIPQAMGTTDGSTADPAGVRVIFHSGPSVTSGSGTISVANEDGTGTFTAAGQPYFQYTGTALGADGILSTNETSSNKTWKFQFTGTITFAFVVFVVAEVQYPNGYIDVSPGVDTITAGGSQLFTGTVRSAVGNPVGGSITWGTSNPGVATVDGSGNVTAVAPGTVNITATSGVRSGSASLAVCPNLAVGGAYVMTSGSVCLSGAAEYTVIPVATGISTLAYSFTGNGIVAVTGPPTPDRIPGRAALQVPRRPVFDEAMHMRMLREQLRAARRTPGLQRVAGRTGGASLAITPGVPVVGATMSLNVGLGYCSPLDSRTATVKSVGTRIILMEDNSNPSGGFSTAQYDSIAATFDTLVYPAVAGNFGSPYDIDTNSRVIALYTAAVNDLTPPASSAYVGGFFYSRDLYSTASCAGSNAGEMFYMLAPDPTGAHGNVRSTAFVKGVTIGTLGHEFQHLINASRRLYGAGGPYAFEQVWLNEGLSHIAEEHVYYASTVHGPGENLDVTDLTASQHQQDAFFEFAEANFGRLRQWLTSPHTSGPFVDADSLAIRGSAWAFLRYASDRRGGIESDLWSGLAFSPDTGMTNLANRLATDPKPWFRDFAAAMYADDAGLGAATMYTQPSWNFRSIYSALDYNPGPACSCAYELDDRNPANGVADAFTLGSGGAAAYERIGVAGGAFAGITSTTPGANLAVIIIRRE